MNTVSLVIMVALMLAIFGCCAWVIKRHFIDRRWLNDGSRFIGGNVYSQWQNGDEQNRIEYVQYVREDERDETDNADPQRFEGDERLGPTRTGHVTGVSFPRKQE